MSLVTLARDAASGLLDLVYPPRCLVCREFGGKVICAHCRAGFEPVAEPVCPRCGRTVLIAGCPDCERGAAHHLAAARAAGRFAGPLREAILQLKYGPKPRLADPLGEYLGEMLASRPFGSVRFDVVVPVPLHRSRLREREFNQAALLAAHAACAVGAPCVESCLVRSRRTRKQTDLRAEQRAANVQTAFSVVDPAAVGGKTVLLVDDVITTLSTVNACARVLREAGAKAVYVAAVARD